MVKCPKCGIRGDYYTPLATLETNFNDDRMIKINRVECDECRHQFLVRDVYKIKYDYGTNIDFE